MALKLGYARVSTEQQNLDRQLDALRSAGIQDKNIFCEKMTGTKSHRPQLDALKEKIELARELDAEAEISVTIESLSRLGRSTKDLLNLLDYFKGLGVQLISLKESIDTNTPTGQLLITVLSAISQFERDLIVQRTSEGLKAARARGRKGGRPEVNPKKLETALALYRSQEFSIRQIVEQTGISQATLYRKIKELDSES